MHAKSDQSDVVRLIGNTAFASAAASAGSACRCVPLTTSFTARMDEMKERKETQSQFVTILSLRMEKKKKKKRRLFP